MKQLSNEDKQIAAQLKARLWYSISKILESELETLQTDTTTHPITANPLFTASLVELAYNQLLSLGEDLERFARHAKRKTITPDDLFLVCRRNDDLQALLGEYWRELNKSIVQAQASETVEINNSVNVKADVDDDSENLFGDSEDDEEFLRVADRKRI